MVCKRFLSELPMGATFMFAPSWAAPVPARLWVKWGYDSFTGDLIAYRVNNPATKLRISVNRFVSYVFNS